MYSRKWKPSKSKAQEFKRQMEEIDKFCYDNHIQASSGNDSYYFEINGQKYRVSNHSVEASNRGAYNELTGELTRGLYHPNGRLEDVIYIHASKTRIIEIYNNLKKGLKLDGRGNVVYEN